MSATTSTLNRHLMRLARSAVSYLPSASLLPLRRLSDLGSFNRPHEADFLCFGKLPPGRQIFLDVGSNRGQSIRSIGLVLDDVSIIAIEPNPVLVAALRARRDQRVIDVHHLALGDQGDGELLLHVPRYGHTLYDTRAAASTDQAAGFLSADWFAFFDPDRGGVEVFRAPMSTIDHLGVDPTIIKIDVEGADHGVVRGGRSTIERCRPILLIEEPSDETVASLAELGYCPFRFTGQTLIKGDRGGLNTFFLAEEHRQSLQQGGVTIGT